MTKQVVEKENRYTDEHYRSIATILDSLDALV